jgi:hypothetical protein
VSVLSVREELQLEVSLVYVSSVITVAFVTQRLKLVSPAVHQGCLGYVMLK